MKNLLLLIALLTTISAQASNNDYRACVTEVESQHFDDKGISNRYYNAMVRECADENRTTVDASDLLDTETRDVTLLK